MLFVVSVKILYLCVAGQARNLSPLRLVIDLSHAKILGDVSPDAAAGPDLSPAGQLCRSLPHAQSQCASDIWLSH